MSECTGDLNTGLVLISNGKCVSEHTGDLNTGLVLFSNGKNVSDHQMLFMTVWRPWNSFVPVRNWFKTSFRGN